MTWKTARDVDIDKAAILRDVLRRNRLRLDAKLAPLNVRDVYDYEVAMVYRRAFYDAEPAIEQAMADQKSVIEAEVVSDLLAAANLTERPTGTLYHYYIHSETKWRWHEFLRDCFYGEPSAEERGRRQDRRQRILDQFRPKLPTAELLVFPSPPREGKHDDQQG